LKQKAEKLFPTMQVGSGYGMTETYDGVISARIKRHMVDWPQERIDEIMVKTGLYYVPAIEARVVDEEGNEVPRDDETIGEIVLRGHWIMEQYFKDPNARPKPGAGGWLHTGDAAKVDAAGYITIVDRITDVIRCGSEMVPTVLLENLACNAPFVLEAMFVGVPDEKWGEIPMALVKLMPGMSAAKRMCSHFCVKEGVEQGKITKWMLPVYVAIVDEIPKTSVGKYNKREVRRQMDRFVSMAKRVRL
jgi:fatty-acyl-CoA synthase